MYYAMTKADFTRVAKRSSIPYIVCRVSSMSSKSDVIEVCATYQAPLWGDSTIGYYHTFSVKKEGPLKDIGEGWVMFDEGGAMRIVQDGGTPRDLTDDAVRQLQWEIKNEIDATVILVSGQ